MITSYLLVAFLLQTQAVNQELGYRFTLPEGFVAFPEGTADHPDAVECWAQDRVAPPFDPLVLCVQRMRKKLPRDAMKASEVPPNTQLRTYQWGAHEIQGLRTYRFDAGRTDFAIVAQVPLRNEAIQIAIAGMSLFEARGDSLMRVTLASLEGEPGWLTVDERSGRLRHAAFAWAAIAILAFGAWRWRRSRTVR